MLTSLLGPGNKGEAAYHGFGESFKAEKQTGLANVLKVEREWNCLT